ncbi:unnamed protein product [Mytilus edulis]|uniref:CCHC-type domain-containing protein n=1 Tax=Mytilus edulis TaxID=6550 RepID=A0A8S3S7C0_MYTED|nr:unnamed protein product [Mytilus edulis]
MSEEEISAVEPMDESQLLKDEKVILLQLMHETKILKIADRHGCDTVHEYLDDPLADSVEDASKLRTAVFRANRKRTANKPYSRGGGRGGFNAREFFRGFSKESGPRNDNYSQQNNSQQQYNDGLCFYCKRPGHTARFCPFKARTFSSTKSAPATITSAPSLS